MTNISQHPSELDFLIDQEKAAQHLGVATKTMEAWRHRGGGPPFVKIGRLCKYRSSDLQTWIEQSIRRSTSEKVAGRGAR